MEEDTGGTGGTELEHLKDQAETSPDHVKIILKAHITKLLYESSTVVSVEYQKDGKAHIAHGPIILATGGLLLTSQRTPYCRSTGLSIMAFLKCYLLSDL